MADYCATGKNEVSMKEGEPLELLKIGGTGWWYIKLLSKYSFKKKNVFINVVLIKSVAILSFSQCHACNEGTKLSY